MYRVWLALLRKLVGIVRAAVESNMSIHHTARLLTRIWSSLLRAVQRVFRSDSEPQAPGPVIKYPRPERTFLPEASWTGSPASKSPLNGRDHIPVSAILSTSATTSTTPNFPARSLEQIEEGLPESVEKRSSMEHKSQLASLPLDKDSSDTESKSPPTTASVFIPILPFESDRYEHDIIIPRDNTLVEIEPITVKFKGHLPEGWSRHVQPEGQPYYIKAVEGRTYMTDTEITKPGSLTMIEHLMDEMEARITRQKDDLPNRFQIYLEPRSSGARAAYYMVDHGGDERCIFWLDKLDLRDHDRQDIGLHTLSHWQLNMLDEYWTHCEYFPHCIPLNSDIFEELSGILMHLIVDMTTTGKVIAPFSADDLRLWLDMIEGMKSLNLSSDDTRAYVVTAVARLMSLIMRSRFNNFYGQHGARLDPDQTVPGEKITRRTLLIRLLSPLLFFAPDRHLEQLRLINPSDFVYRQSWSQFIAAWEKPWNDYILYATVLLAVNVSFLAIPDASPAINAVTTGQVASLCSTITSIGCIVIGLLLVNEDHTNPKDAYTSYTYFEKLRSIKFEYEPLAILYSLPYALLMWSMLTFVIAMAYLCFRTSSVQRIVTGVVVGIVFSLVAWEIAVHWKSSRSTGDYNLFYAKDIVSHVRHWLAQ